MEQNVQGSGRGIIPGSLPKMWIWHLRTWFSDERGGDTMLMIGYDDFLGLFNINDSMILRSIE